MLSWREHGPALPWRGAPGPGERHQHGGRLHLSRVLLRLLPPDLGLGRLGAPGRQRVREEKCRGRSSSSPAVSIAGRQVGLTHVTFPLQTEVTGTVAAPLRFFRAALLGAQSPPLLPIELLPDAGRCGDDVTFLILVRGGRQAPGAAGGGARPALAVAQAGRARLHAGVAAAAHGGGASLGHLACTQ